jgi:NodT family efflux transporter outer membrane factor (OMF) lipoprotein
MAARTSPIRRADLFFRIAWSQSHMIERACGLWSASQLPNMSLSIVRRTNGLACVRSCVRSVFVRLGSCRCKAGVSMVGLLRRSLCSCFALALAGCAVGPDFVPPDPGLPVASFLNPHDKTAPARESAIAAPDPEWWALFRDPELIALERRVATTNLDVQTASVRLAESRFQRNSAASALLPGVSGKASEERYKLSENLISPLASQAGLPASEVQQIAQPFNLWQYGFDASWELDIWGKTRRQVESADAQVAASRELRRAMLISALAEVARDYMQLRGIQTQIRIVRNNLATAVDTFNLTKTRMDRGVAVGTDMENAAAQVEAVRAQIPDLERQQSEAMNALNLLLDQPPGALTGELGFGRSLPPMPRKPPVGVASDLARRRPDIRQAEAQLHAATADIGVAIGDFYPSVKLNGSVGFQALDFASLWKGSPLQYSYGPSVSLPIFDGGRLRSVLNLREAQQQEAAINYHRTVLQAWHDVVNALVAFRTEQERRARLNAQVGHARAALQLSRSRYSDGVEAFITVLDAERTLLLAEQQAAASATNAAVDLVALYKALGGGWEETFPLAPLPNAPPPIIAALDGEK